MQALRERRRSITGAFELLERSHDDESTKNAIADINAAVKESIKLEKGALSVLEQHPSLSEAAASVEAESFFILGLLERVTMLPLDDFDWAEDVDRLWRAIDHHFDRIERGLLPTASRVLNTNDLAAIDRALGPTEFSRASPG